MHLGIRHPAKLLLIIGVALALLAVATAQINFVCISGGKPHYLNTERIVPASEVLDKIKHDEAVEYSDVTIVGDLDISGMELLTVEVKRDEHDVDPFIEIIDPSEDPDAFVPTLKVIRSPIFIINSTICGNVTIDYAIFNSSVDFSDTKFTEDVDFVGARFLGDACFEFTKFNGRALFTWAKFERKAFFTGTSFGGVAGFAWVQFYGDTYFPMSKFNDIANFEGARFFDDSYFWYSEFNDDSIFTRTRFDKENDFSNVKFSGVAGFTSSQFNENADFKESELSGDFLLIGSKFDTLDLTNSIFTDKSHINLRNSKFVRSDSDRIFVSWRDIKDHIVYNEVVYLALIDNFKRLGMFEESDDCYYQYKNIRREREQLWYNKIFDTFAWLSCGYGVRPEYTLLCSLTFIPLFGLIYWCGNAIHTSTKKSKNTFRVRRQKTMKNKK